MDVKQFYKEIEKEEERNAEFLHLTANELIMSDTARRFMGSRLNDRYFVGAGEDGMMIGSPFTALGMPGVAGLVRAAEEAVKEMLGAAVVNLNCLSGVHAMMCAILSTTEPGDVVMSVNRSDGGHFATEGIIERVGRGHVFAPYDTEHLRFDAEALGKVFRESGAKAFYMDVSYYVNPHNLVEIREALGKDAIIIYDASHTMGLIMGGVFQDPFAEGVDVICANTHKTLPGPQKGMVAFKDEELGEKASGIINGCLFSSTHTSSLIALAVTILEMKEFGRAYAEQVVKNSNALGEALVALGHEVRRANTGRWSENHQVHLLTEKVGDYRELYKRLYGNGIAVNFDNPLGKGIFIRLGTQEVTRWGMKEEEMKVIAELLDKSFKGEDVKGETETLRKRFGKVGYSFDV